MPLSTTLRCVIQYLMVSLDGCSLHDFPILTRHRLLAHLHFYCDVGLARFVLSSYIAQDHPTSVAIYPSPRTLWLSCSLEWFSRAW
jgi:hypothetical protein